MSRKIINIAENFYENSFKNHRCARTPWAVFKGSWAGQLFIEKHKNEIIKIYNREKKEYGWLDSCTYILGID